ncbi:hypothetical protein [Lacinutrix sp.]|uniref:hypothetical protein n=1 Tax=Lacinutrix sp. TaxID=1937692 RepID=UPI0025C11A7E|nr:hypothetical protein [Lacinutrix sp.]
MKNTYIKLMAFLFIASASVACVNDDETFGVNSDKPVATTTVTMLTINEGETGVIPFTVSQEINTLSQFKIEILSSSSATQILDYTAGGSSTDVDTGIPGEGFEITIPAFTSNFDIPVNAIMDILPEDTETAVLKISAAGIRTILADATVTVNIVNVSNEELGFILDWNTDVTYSFLDTVTEEDGDDTDAIVSELTENLCDHVDFDLIQISSASGYLAGTGDCPEIDLAFGILPDDTYTLIVDLFSITLSETPIDPVVFPFTLTIGKAGSFNATLAYDDIFTSNSPTSAPNGFNGGDVVVGTIIVSGGLYTVLDRDGNLIATE